MAKELSEESKFQISVKTLISIVVAVVTVVSAYFGLMASINSKFEDLEDKVQKALELPKPGTGTYTIDMGDPAATNTWPPTRMEFNMKDQMARNKIDAVIKEMDEIKEDIKYLRK
jgi:pyruvate/oxaloacetate carboxyltransferase